MSKPIKFAVIGLGHIGKRHAAMIQGNEQAQLVAVCDVLPAGEVGWADSDLPYFRSLEDLLSSDVALDVVNVCTPNASMPHKRS